MVIKKAEAIRWLEGGLDAAFEQAQVTRRSVFLDAFHPG